MVEGRGPRVYCADVGSEARGRFGWAALDGGYLVDEGSSIPGLASAVVRDLNEGALVALGFECPLFVPIALDSVELTRARVGEGSRPWCAGAGAGSMAVGLTQVVWLLQRIRQELRSEAIGTVRWAEAVQADGAALFLWEAFVSATAKGLAHTDDAEIGAKAFWQSLPNPHGATAIRSEIVHSLVGAALLRTGWCKDLAVLEEPCLVIRA